MPPPPPPPTSSLLLTTTTVLHFHTFTAASPQTGREMAVAFFFFFNAFFFSRIRVQIPPGLITHVFGFTANNYSHDDGRKKKKRKKESFTKSHWCGLITYFASVAFALLQNWFPPFTHFGLSLFFFFPPPLFPLGIWSWWALLKDWNRKVIVFSCSCSVTGFSFLPK